MDIKFSMVGVQILSSTSIYVWKNKSDLEIIGFLNC